VKKSVRESPSVLDVVGVADALDEPDRACDGAGRVALQAERHGEVEDHLRVRRPFDQRIELRVDLQDEIALHLRPAAHDAVVAPQPVVVSERVTVRLLHRGARRRADVGEEEMRLDVTGDLAQVAIVPRRLDASEHTRAVRAVPADAEAVAVRGLGTHARREALLDQRMLRAVQHLVHLDRLSVVREPAAHQGPPLTVW
jgi:hypothetical protein